MDKITIGQVEVMRLMCGTVQCTYCNHKQNARAWYHERDTLPIREEAVRCVNCGNPLPTPPDAPP